MEKTIQFDTISDLSSSEYKISPQQPSLQTLNHNNILQQPILEGTVDWKTTLG